MRLAVGDERFEQSGQNIGSDTKAGIGNSQNDFILIEDGRKREDAAIWHGFPRIFDKVAQHSGEARKIDIEIAVVTNGNGRAHTCLQIAAMMPSPPFVRRLGGLVVSSPAAG